MQLRTLILAIGACAACLGSAQTKVDWSRYTDHIVSGELVVKAKPGQAAASKRALTNLKAKVVRTLPNIGWQVIRLQSGMTVQTAISRLTASKAFLVTEPNIVAKKAALPNDPMLNELYAIDRMQMSKAWDIALGDSSVVVAIIDDGVDINHPDLKDNCIPGYDFADNDTNVVSPQSHGTHVAGTAAATGNNGIGIAGIAYGVSILPVKVFSDNSGGATFDAITAGILYSADQGADVINMSLGAPVSNQMMEDAVEYAWSKNVVICASAMNENTSFRYYPAASENVIAVGASTSSDTRASFSNYGPDWVDVAAPGEQILSTVVGHGYEKYNGTSMASPAVAGLAALMISSAGKGNMTNTEVRQIIESTCDPIGLDWNAHGRVNAFEAVNSIGTPISDLPTPTPPAPYDGTVTYSDGAFSTEDGVSATIRSVRRPGVGLTGSFTTGFDMTGMTLDELRQATLTLSVTGESLATIQIFLQDLSGTWKMISSQPGRTTGKTTEFKVSKSDLMRYMTGAGKLNVMVRSFAPIRLASRLKGVTKVDLLKVAFNGVRKPGATP